LITKEKITALAEAHLKGTNIFLTGLKIGSDNHINVFIDGDEGVTIKDCVNLSRALEEELSKGREDFSLDVSSHGATTPLALPRQYPKHKGRTFEIRLMDGSTAEGEMISADDEGIMLEFSTRENKPVGKGKITVVKQQRVNFADIKEAKIKLKY
jgi:ribosome maturation factor RimP